MVEILRKKLDMDFNQGVKHVEEIVREQGFSHLLTKNIHEIFKLKLGPGTYSKYAIILVCGAEYAKAALDVSKNVGLLFPCSFIVFEEDSQVWVEHVSIMKVAAKIGLAPGKKMKPVIELTSQAVKAAWDKF
jgi:uncharacterized protein (DUF302 family)